MLSLETSSLPKEEKLIAVFYLSMVPVASYEGPSHFGSWSARMSGRSGIRGRGGNRGRSGSAIVSHKEIFLRLIFARHSYFD